MLRFPVLFLVGLLGMLAALAVVAVNLSPTTTNSVSAAAAAAPENSVKQSSSGTYEIRLDGAYNTPGTDPHIKFSGGCSVNGSSDYKTVDGTTPESYSVAGTGLSCTFQKQSGNNFHLKATVLRDGQVVKEIETVAEYGVIRFAI